MENSPPEKQTVRVTILSRPYTLRTAGDPREVEALATSVDDLLLTIAGKAPDSDSTRIAVLACLHLADRVRALEKELEGIQGLRRSLDRKAARVAGMLDQLIASAGGPDSQ
jgi:cell division protein ZapA